MRSVPTSFTGDTYAPETQLQKDAIAKGGQVADALGASAPVGTFTGNDIKAANGDYLSPDSNPFLRANINAAIDPVTQQLQRIVLPGISNASQMNGAFGGDGQRLLEGQAYGDWARNAGDISAQMIAANYAAERQNQINAGQNFTTDAAAEALPTAMLSQLGGQQQGFDQIGLNNILAQLQMDSSLPFNGLAQASNILSGQGSASTAIGPGVNRTASGISGALGGAASGYMLGSQGGWEVPGGIIGGILGALGGYAGS
jgi:hypothetical protein